MWSTKWLDDRRKEKLNKHVTQKKLPELDSAFKCYGDIWNVNLKPQMRSNALGFQRIQNTVLRSANAVMYTTYSFIQCKNNKTDIPLGSLIEQLVDVIALLSHPCHDLSQRTRDVIKHALAKSCKNLPIMSQKILKSSLVMILKKGSKQVLH